MEPLECTGNYQRLLIKTVLAFVSEQLRLNWRVQVLGKVDLLRRENYVYLVPDLAPELDWRMIDKNDQWQIVQGFRCHRVHAFVMTTLPFGLDMRCKTDFV
jgi:hypothetical protein